MDLGYGWARNYEDNLPTLRFENSCYGRGL